MPDTNFFMDSVWVARALSSVPARIDDRRPMTSMARCTVRLLICTRSVGICAMRDAMASTCSSSSASGYARLAHPSCAASTPENESPVSIDSIPPRIPNSHAWYCMSGVPKRTAG